MARESRSPQEMDKGRSEADAIIKAMYPEYKGRAKNDVRPLSFFSRLASALRKLVSTGR